MKDYYAILGVLPSAEDVVIKAAYKALALRYHPDRFKGSADEATRKMAEINDAYAVLSDSAKRTAYDQTRKQSSEGVDFGMGGAQEDQEPAYDPLEEDWEIAVSHYPDLAKIAQALGKTSWRLAYSYKAGLLENKNFSRRKEIADLLETGYLSTYFGDSKEVQAFAKELIHSGNMDAARFLNKSVKVMGADIVPSELISQIRRKFRIYHASGDTEPKPKSPEPVKKDAAGCLVFLIILSVIVVTIASFANA